MGTTSSRRSAAGEFGLAALACAATLALAGQANAAETAYPAGGSTFDADPQGWTESAASCGPVDVGLLCTTVNVHDPAAGNPPGSLATRTNVTVNALGTFTGTGTWTSPPFEVSGSTPVTGAAFAYDRQLEDTGALDLEPASEVVVSLVDDTAGTTIPVLTDSLTSAANSVFAQRREGVPTGPLVDGHTYRLRIATTTTSSLAGAVGEASLRFDNVALTVERAAAGGGGNGDDGGNSPGVTVVRGPYSDVEINDLINGLDIDAESGNGRDGSLIPVERCTILGTSGPDRIIGTAGNDVICGLGGDDVITSAGGRDAIDGADGNDRLAGGIDGDLLLGLRGNDRLDGGGDADRIGGGAGNDRIEAGNGNDVASGASGNDSVGGEAGSDRLRGLAGRDRVNGGPGRDRLDGGAGKDVLRGFSGNDRLAGGARRDRLDGGGGRDRLAGGSGPDRLVMRDSRRDVGNGGAGRDRATGDSRDRVRAVESMKRR
jgi:RTX calcium-binding nonapeptide repeat (4 copies)